MRKNFYKLGVFLLNFGVNPRQFYYSLLGLPSYLKTIIVFILLRRQQSSNYEFKFALYPILADVKASAGVAKGHYFHQDLWAARKIHEMSPVSHIDVGSRIDGFIAHLLTFRDVIVVDVRKLESLVRGLKFIQADLMSDPESVKLRSDSVSSLHAIEHFGLGRYGDPICVDGWLRGLNNLFSMVLPGGHLYLSVPIGRQRIEFNAHRVFDPNTIIKVALENGFELSEFSFIDDNGDFHENVDIIPAESCQYGCGCFLLRRCAE